MDFFRRKISIFSDSPKKGMAKAKNTAKKTTKKKTAKTVKTAKTGRAAKKPKMANVIEVVEVSPENYFWVNGGDILKDLYDLQDALVVMNEDQFDFHTKRDGNDFARWIEDVFGEKALAQKIAKAKNKKSTMVVLARYIG